VVRVARRRVVEHKRPAFACLHGDYDVGASVHLRTGRRILVDDDRQPSSMEALNGNLPRGAQVPNSEQPERLGDGLASQIGYHRLAAARARRAGQKRQ
jgi:hypothetical protein